MHYAQLHQVRQELTGPGGPFEIVESVVLGQQMKVYKNAPPSAREFWLSTAAFGPRDYLVYQDERLGPTPGGHPKSWTMPSPIQAPR